MKNIKLKSLINEAKEKVVSKLSDIPNVKKEVDAGRVTYRGLGAGKVAADYDKLAGEGCTKIKVNKKEYVITNTDFNKLGGIKKMNFGAPFRR